MLIYDSNSSYNRLIILSATIVEHFSQCFQSKEFRRVVSPCWNIHHGHGGCSENSYTKVHNVNGTTNKFAGNI
jgi:hypothetical protein